ncbi:hypothetical protein [Saprospira grandis]|uniref:Uncharacterized protein n=1 Tax=Saprospira grandis (strain Lewin) TaxID=984262 RepID=H6L275_SAPGL|nr:hypothetical protein [Saprospira grandis]AFC24713.1 hypothetical protein SGRA_1982 [Saprospira grandis str. Lewin]
MDTSVILIFSILEDFAKRQKEISVFKLYTGRNIDLVSIEAPDDPDLDAAWYGGSKYMSQFILIGAYKSLEIDKFIAHLKTEVNWEEPEEVQLLVYDERTGDEIYRLINIFEAE